MLHIILIHGVFILNTLCILLWNMYVYIRLSTINIGGHTWPPYLLRLGSYQWVHLNKTKLSCAFDINISHENGITVDSRYLAPVGSQNSRARVKWFSRYLALSREGHDSRIQDHRPALPGVYNSQTVCWAIIEVLTFPGSLHTSTSHL